MTDAARGPASQETAREIADRILDFATAKPSLKLGKLAELAESAIAAALDAERAAGWEEAAKVAETVAAGIERARGGRDTDTILAREIAAAIRALGSAP